MEDFKRSIEEAVREQEKVDACNQRLAEELCKSYTLEEARSEDGETKLKSMILKAMGDKATKVYHRRHYKSAQEKQETTTVHNRVHYHYLELLKIGWPKAGRARPNSAKAFQDALD